MRAKEAIDARSVLEKVDVRIGVPFAQATVAGEANRLPKILLLSWNPDLVEKLSGRREKLRR
jgi:hypothetical protein